MVKLLFINKLIYRILFNLLILMFLYLIFSYFLDY